MPSFKQGDFGLKYKLHSKGNPDWVLAEQKFRIRKSDGSVVEGVTDSNGESPLLKMNELEKLVIELIKDE